MNSNVKNIYQVIEEIKQNITDNHMRTTKEDIIGSRRVLNRHLQQKALQMSQKYPPTSDYISFVVLI